MSARFERARSAIEEALGRCATSVAALGPGEWRVSVDASSPVWHVRWDEAWLRFVAATRAATAAAGTVADDGDWDRLRRNAELPGPCRFARGPAGGDELLAEIPLDADADVEARCREIVGAFAAPAAGAPAGTTSAGNPPGANLAACRELLAEAGRSARERPDGCLVVDLGRSGAPGPAVLEAGPEGRGVRLAVELARAGSLADASRRALGIVLLASAHLVRFARPVVEEDDTGATLRFETRFESRPTPGELDHALAALAAAGDVCVREVEVLRDEVVATEFLTVRGESS